MKLYDSPDDPYLEKEKKHLETLKNKIKERSQYDYSNDPRSMELY